METSKTKELTNFHYISLTDTGNVRENNEDYLGYFDTINGHIFVVCDGCGGLPCGEKASQTVVNSLKFFFSNFYYKDPFQAIKDAVDYAQNRIREEEREDSSCEGMACTMVLVLIRYNKAYYAHIGDSRVYYFTKRELTQLTKDDSYVQMLVDQGKLTPQEAESHPRKNELVRVMGMNPPCQPHICSRPINPNDGDLILLCTDGLYNMVKEQDIKATLAHRGYIEDKGMELIKAAKNNGGLDNITLQIIKFYNVDYEKTEQRPTITEFVNKNKSNILIGVAAALILIIGLMFSMRYTKDNQCEVYTNQKNIFLKIDPDTIPDTDSLLETFGLDFSKVVYVNQGGKKLINLPIRKIVTVRYYDTIYTLAKLYHTTPEKIMKVNGLKSEHLKPGTELIIL
jgi:serine/threonine protein phosphatase PrpC